MRRRPPVLLLAALSLGPTAASADLPAEIPGLVAWHWGMSAAEVLAALPAGSSRLAPPWDYGRMHAPARIPEMEVGGLRFVAMPQIETASGRLQQVMLERRDKDATPAAFRRLRATLERDYGPPTQVCETRRRTGDPESITVVWRLPATTVDLAFLDYRTSGILYLKPDLTPDPLVSPEERRLVTPHSLPRRLVLRFHDTAAAHLSPCLPHAPPMN